MFASLLGLVCSVFGHFNRLVLCGAPPAALGKVALLDVIFQQKRLVGSIVGGRVVINEMFQFCAANNVKPKTQVRHSSRPWSWAGSCCRPCPCSRVSLALLLCLGSPSVAVPFWFRSAHRLSVFRVTIPSSGPLMCKALTTRWRSQLVPCRQ